MLLPDPPSAWLFKPINSRSRSKNAMFDEHPSLCELWPKLFFSLTEELSPKACQSRLRYTNIGGDDHRLCFSARRSVSMYDALIVGARCAGSPTAMLLARKGYRVLLVDRATFPSDAPRNHVIHAPGIARLKQWGLLDKVIASNCPPLRHITFDLGPFALVGSSPAIDGISEGYGPRRKVLDTILVDAARASGVEVREGFSVQEVLMDGDRVIGIRGRTAGGRIVTETARIVIGADGMHSSVAHTVQTPEYDTKPALSCAYYTYYSGVPIEGVELYMRGRRLIGAFPTNDGLLCSLVQFPNQEFHAFRSDIVGNYQEQLDLVPSLAERLRNGKQEERFVGTADLPNFFRKPYGPGWALVGDAGYHKDPYTGQGITDAFRDA